MNILISPNVRFRRRFCIFLTLVTVFILFYRLLTLDVSTDFQPQFSQDISLLVASGVVKYGSGRHFIVLTPHSRVQSLMVGDKIQVESDSQAMIYWGMTAQTVLHSGAHVIIREAMIADQSRISLDVESGRVTNEIVNYLGPRGGFEVGMPQKKMTASVRGSAFEVNSDTQVISSLEHVVTLSGPFDEMIFIGEGRRKDFNQTLNTLASKVDLGYRRQVQEQLYEQYQELQKDRIWWKRCISWIQSNFGLNPERFASVQMYRGKDGGINIATQDASSRTSPKDLFALAVVFEDELLLARTGERIMLLTDDTSLKVLYARDITLHIYYQSMDALKNGQVPSWLALKSLITSSSLQSSLMILPDYFRSYSPGVRLDIIRGAASSPWWKEFIRMLEVGAMRTQDIAKLKSMIPSSPFDLLK